MTTCAYCDDTLHGEIHAVEGKLFCSKGCAIYYKADELSEAVPDEARTWYDEHAETVNAADIGIESDVYKCIWCHEEFELSELTNTNFGRICDTCLAAIKSHGEAVIIYE